MKLIVEVHEIHNDRFGHHQKIEMSPNGNGDIHVSFGRDHSNDIVTNHLYGFVSRYHGTIIAHKGHLYYQDGIRDEHGHYHGSSTGTQFGRWDNHEFRVKTIHASVEGIMSGSWIMVVNDHNQGYILIPRLHM